MSDGGTWELAAAAQAAIKIKDAISVRLCILYPLSIGLPKWLGLRTNEAVFKSATRSIARRHAAEFHCSSGRRQAQLPSERGNQMGNLASHQRHQNADIGNLFLRHG